MEEFKYDIAISFLQQDISLASALHEKLREGFNVFFFPRNQEQLAGTDGLVSMREPFLRQSRLNVVLYRPRWGKTPWTGVEAAAIISSKERGKAGIGVGVYEGDVHAACSIKAAITPLAIFSAPAPTSQTQRSRRYSPRSGYRHRLSPCSWPSEIRTTRSASESQPCCHL